MSIWHLAFAADWDRAGTTGSYAVSTRGATVAEVGYLHASEDRAQVDAVARRFYADVTTPLLVLEIDEAALPAYGLTVRREPADPTAPTAGAELFPHVYGGALPVAAVRTATPYQVPAPARPDRRR